MSQENELLPSFFDACEISRCTIAESRTRPICEHCERPQKTCLCLTLPRCLLDTAGHVIILRHPHEKKRRLATVPLLARCLSRFTVLHGRKLVEESNAEVGMLLEAARQGTIPLYVLFPALGAADVADAARLPAHQEAIDSFKTTSSCATTAGTFGGYDDQQMDPCGRGQHVLQDAYEQARVSNQYGAKEDRGLEPSSIEEGSREQQLTSSPAYPLPAYILLAVDGTWREAREMFKLLAMRYVQPAGPGMLVSLNICREECHSKTEATTTANNSAAAGAPATAASSAATDVPDSATAAVRLSDYETSGVGVVPCPTSKSWLIRKEPTDGYLSTHEAVSRALALLEGNDNLLAPLLAPLRSMTEMQAMFDPATQARVNL